MSIATLVRSMAAAGAPPEAIALAVEAVEGAHAQIEAVRAKAREKKRAQRAAAKDGDMDGTVPGQSPDMAGTVPTTPPPPAPSFPQTPNQPHPPTPGETPRTRKGTRLPAEFVIADDWLEWAEAERGWTRTEAESEGDNFCDHWRAKPGAGAVKLDWHATWRVWVRNSNRNGRNGQRHHHHDRFGDRMRDPVLDDLARGLDP